MGHWWRGVRRLMACCLPVIVLLSRGANVQTQGHDAVSGAWVLSRGQLPLPADQIRRCVEGRETDDLADAPRPNVPAEAVQGNRAARRVAAALDSIIDVPEGLTIIFDEGHVVLTDSRGQVEKFSKRREERNFAELGTSASSALWTDETRVTVKREWPKLGTWTSAYVVEPDHRLHVTSRFTHARTGRSVVLQRLYDAVGR